VIDRDWYRGRTVLVLGGLGFIGVNLSRQLASAGARLTVATRRRPAHAQEASELESSGTRVVEVDLRDGKAIRRLVDRQEVIFNLAARSGAVRSVQDPFTDLDVNCRGALVLLEALRAANRDARLVFVGSRLEYGRGGADPVAEDRPADPLCAHAVHKLVVEKYLRVYGRLFGLQSTVARISNPYGPGQPIGRKAYGVVNYLIHLALAGQTLTVFGDGSQRRDYIYVDDVVTALMELAAAASSDARPYNVATGIGTRFIDMARAIVAAVGSGRVELAEWPRLAREIETGDFIADVSRIKRELGWAAAVPLDEGLQRTVSFYRAQVAS
jgi:UDP-glucose 4-epimerase